MRFAITGRSTPYLRALTLLAMAIPAFAALVVESPVPVETRCEAAVLWLLCLAPAWFYFGNDARFRRPFPFLALIGVLYGLYYALSPALGAYNQHGTIVLSPRTDYDDAIFAALVGWLSLLGGYSIGRLVTAPKCMHAPEQIDDGTLRRYGAALMVAGLLTQTLGRLYPIPIEVGGLLTFFTTLGWFGSAILVAMAVQGSLTFPFRLLSYFGVGGFLLTILGNGMLSPVAIYGVTVMMAAWIGYGRFKLSWSIVAIVGALSVISLRGVTNQYRMLSWYGNEETGLVSESTLFVKLLTQSVEMEGIGPTLAKGFSTTEERSANLDVLADVIRRTPAEVPYWGGETYLSLIGAFVPRFLWPDKPTKELGQGFGHRYGYLNPRDERTSLNLPVLVEFYANYGMVGVAIGMWLVGFVYFVIDRAVNNPGQSMMLSLTGIVLIIPLVNIESDFSLTFGGLIMNGAALWVVLGMIRRGASRRTVPVPSHQPLEPLTTLQQSGS